MKKEKNENLEMIMQVMFSSGGIECKDNFNFKVKGWQLKASWTARQEQDFEIWLADFLVRNWQGLLDKKPTKKFAKVQAQFFVLQYGWKVRPLKIEDFTPLITDGQCRDAMTERQYKSFIDWMMGQTMSTHGYYKWDVERFLGGDTNSGPTWD